jgi:outer membrane protein assembly factor BamB
MRAHVALAVVLGLGGCAADAAPSPPAPTPAPAMKLLADVKAWGIASAGGKLVVVDDGFLTVTALDGATGKPAWTTKLQAAPARGTHELVVVDRTTALAWFAAKAHVLDTATGKLVRSYETIEHAGKCGLWVNEGMCARVCECSFALADCATGTLRSATYKGRYVEEFDPDGGRSSGCWGFDGWPLGMAGKLALVSVDDPKPHVAGIDPATAKEVWKRDMMASPQTYETGHSPDGKTCWFSNHDDSLVVLDCASGKELWTTPGVKDGGRHLVWYIPGRGLFEQKRATATLHAERTGKPLWTAQLPAGAVSWPKGTAPVADLPRPTGVDDALALVLLDPATGKQLKTVRIPKGADLIPDAGGAFYLAQNKELVAFDASGAEIARRALPAFNIELGETLIAMGRDVDIVVVDKKTLKELLRLPGKHLSFEVEGALGVGRVAVWQYDAKSVGRVRLYGVTP